MNAVRRFFVVSLLSTLAIPACHHHVPDHPTTAAADEVTIVMTEPEPSTHEYLAEIQGEGSGLDVATANAVARDNLKANAATFRATTAVIDKSSEDRKKREFVVLLQGRAFRRRER